MQSTPSAYVEAAVSGIPLLFVVLGLVTFYGKAGLTGPKQLLASMGTGLAIGLLYALAQTRPPSGDWYVVYVYWFGAAFYGVGLGLVASGIYETGKALTVKAISQVIEQLRK